MDAQFWDERYESRQRLWSGEVNGVLAAEAADLPPGQALDVGCGEGADALWLAARGWRVTAIDISEIALERAAARASGIDTVAWTRADLAHTAMPAGAFDLVSAQYYPFTREAGTAALRRLLASVAPGGTLLVAGHDPADLSPETLPDFDPNAYYWPTDIAGFLDADWTVLTNERRPRVSPTPPGSGHTHDTVLRARRLR